MYAPGGSDGTVCDACTELVGGGGEGDGNAAPFAAASIRRSSPSGDKARPLAR